MSVIPLVSAATAAPAVSNVTSTPSALIDGRVEAAPIWPPAADRLTRTLLPVVVGVRRTKTSALALVSPDTRAELVATKATEPSSATLGRMSDAITAVPVAPTRDTRKVSPVVRSRR